jgi:hypothetical protein
MPTHTTRLLRATPPAHAIAAATVDGTISNTRLEVRPGPRGQFTVTIEQVERLPRHKRGITRNVTFVISRAGLDHLCSVGDV